MSLLKLFTLSLILLSCLGEALVPPSQTFHYVNEGEFGPYILEYDPYYRPLPIGTSPFQLFFYNTTPNAYTLAMLMGTRRSESLRRWVWEANRGNPVGENATFSLRTDGNLVLAEADGRVAWQSDTANKNVVGFDLLPNGNMVLYDAKGKFVWQSFDSPTDTLLVGQSLKVNGPNKLVSRLSPKENKNGPYSLVFEPKILSLYYKSENSPTPLLYYDDGGSVQYYITTNGLTFNSTLRLDDGSAYDIELGYSLAQIKYNSTLSYLRLGIDGGLRAFTFYPPVFYQGWEETYTLFPRYDGISGDECRLPERCGQFGLCEDSQCVACPSPNGLLGWSKTCAPPRVTSCKDVTYYEIQGVDHFSAQYNSGSGPIKEADCQKRCTSICKCAGFFYKRAESKCWVVYDLKTLIKVDNATHVGFIKIPK